MQEDVGRLRERLRREAMRMERLMADERRKAERLAKAERKAMGRDIRQLENQVNQGWQEEVGELKSEIKQLRQLMVTGKKRAAEAAQESSTRPSAISSAWTSVARSANWLPPSQLRGTRARARDAASDARRTSRRRSASLRKTEDAPRSPTANDIERQLPDSVSETGSEPAVLNARYDF